MLGSRRQSPNRAAGVAVHDPGGRHHVPDLVALKGRSAAGSFANHEVNRSTLCEVSAGCPKEG